MIYCSKYGDKFSYTGKSGEVIGVLLYVKPLFINKTIIEGVSFCTRWHKDACALKSSAGMRIKWMIF